MNDFFCEMFYRPFSHVCEQSRLLENMGKKKYKDLYADCGKGLFLNAQGIFPNELRILVKVEVKWTTKMCNLFCNLAVKRVDY